SGPFRRLERKLGVVSRKLLGVTAIVVLGVACGDRSLQPGGTGGGGSGGAGPADPGGASCSRIALDPGAFNPCGRTYAIAFSPDGRLIATGTEAARPNVHLWQIGDGTHLRDLDAAGGATYHVEFSPDGALLATAGGYPDSGGAIDTLPVTVKLWNVADGTLV